MGRKRILTGAAAALALIAPAGAAGAAPRATTIRIGSHPAFVRVVVQFAGATAPAGQDVELATGDRLHNVTASIAGATSVAAPVEGSGVRASIVPSPSGVVVRIRSAAGRFAYVHSAALSHPGRLSIDLIRSFSMAGFSTGGCFERARAESSAGSVTVRYRLARPIFENQWIVQVRRTDGRLVRPPTSQFGSPGTYTAMLLAPVARRQRGVVDLVDGGAKDAGVACLTRVPVRLRL